jgi:hypothetical protein
MKRFVGIFLFWFCSVELGSAQTPAEVEHFEKKVRPILVEQCLSCHGAEQKKIKGGLKLNSRADLLKGGDTGPAIMPGKPEYSLLMNVIDYDGDVKMPPKGKLKDHEIKAIEQWIRAGAPWPGGETEASKPTQPSNGPLFTPEQKNYWAFQPLKRVVEATVRDRSWGKTTIDSFILAKLENVGIKPAPAANKSELLRRVTYDLIGLPPTPDELQAFLANDSAEAFDRVVDRLLESPQYGERWGRHWLDVARYADSNGLDENTAYSNAWRYRDYVIRSFNQNKPFNRFIVEQIAGDLLPPSEDAEVQRERYTALGYLALGAKLLAEPDKQKMVLDIADEQLDTVGKGLLGLTMGCARCHDHKFDPIPTKDYYSLLGIFTSTRTMDNLNTVAKTFERKLVAEQPGDADKRKKLETVRKDLRKLEAQFGKTPEKDKEKRTEIHLKAQEKRAEIKKLESELPEEFNILGVEEGSNSAYGTQPRNLYVQARGNYVTPTEEAPAQFLRILAGEKQESFVSIVDMTEPGAEPNKTRFGKARKSSGRLELSQWLTDPKANPLTPRVLVNRIWLNHFGYGLVRSPDNFGKLGERPSHPELLDYLANQFVESGWNIKSLHRQILRSSTYQMSSKYDASAFQKDPENRLLWRYTPRRLDAESIRDAMLHLGGNLDTKQGGSLLQTKNFEYVGDEKYDSTRRSVYLPVIRGKLFPFFQTFDFPDPTVMSGLRFNTVVAPQALFLMNSPFVQKQASLFAQQLSAGPMEVGERVKRAYRAAYSREPSPDETQRSLRFVNQYMKLAEEQGEANPKKRSEAAWQAFAQALLCSSEFLQAH